MSETESIVKLVKESVRAGKAILGYRESIKFLKTNKPKFVIIAENAPDNIKDDIYYAVDDKKKIKVFEGTSRELGTLCGKPFPVTTIVIKK
ncbi:MAG: 50S ribosomal protein L30e [Candidatus Aenigmarchaeota archaeon]|nr:50S ribosomal protein L30e [Candidatus Aenigmarchaeota archaeon]